MARLTAKRDNAAKFVTIHPPDRKRCKRLTQLAVEQGYIVPPTWAETLREVLLKPFQKRPVDYLWPK